jgi:hypothetical protein
MCEVGFSMHAATISKYYCGLDVASDMRIHDVYTHSQLKELCKTGENPPFFALVTFEVKVNVH